MKRNALAFALVLLAVFVGRGSFAYFTNDSYAQIYEHTDGGTTIACVTAGNWYRWVSSTVAKETGSSTADGDTSGQITIGARGAGTYRIGWSAGFDADKASQIEWAILIGDSKQNNIASFRDISNPNDTGSASSTGITSAVLSAGDVITLATSSDTANTDVSASHISLWARRIGP